MYNSRLEMELKFALPLDFSSVKGANLQASHCFL